MNHVGMPAGKVFNENFIDISLQPFIALIASHLL